MTNIAGIVYNLVNFITKLSILIQFIRIFVTHRRDRIYWCIHVLIWVNALFCVAATIVLIMTCLPRQKIWNPNIKGHCINMPAALTASAAINVASDVSILILPIYKVWQLQMSRKKKSKFSSYSAREDCKSRGAPTSSS